MHEVLLYVDDELLSNRFHVIHSNPSTFTMSGASCWTRWLKEIQAGFYACCHVPFFVDNLGSTAFLSKMWWILESPPRGGQGKTSLRMVGVAQYRPRAWRKTVHHGSFVVVSFLAWLRRGTGLCTTRSYVASRGQREYGCWRNANPENTAFDACRF